MRTPYVRAVIQHLGYPSYFLVILGVWKVLGAAALLVPRFPRLKEWAYAGAFFNYTGALASHLAAGDSVDSGLIALAGVLVASWALRPSARRLGPSPGHMIMVSEFHRGWKRPFPRVALPKRVTDLSRRANTPKIRKTSNQPPSRRPL